MLYAPGLATKADVASVVASVDRPVNVLMGVAGFDASVRELEELGVSRISLGSSLARAALGEFVRAAREVSEQGTFTFSARAMVYGELNAMFERLRVSRSSRPPTSSMAASRPSAPPVKPRSMPPTPPTPSASRTDRPGSRCRPPRSTSTPSRPTHWRSPRSQTTRASKRSLHRIRMTPVSNALTRSVFMANAGGAWDNAKKFVYRSFCGMRIPLKK